MVSGIRPEYVPGIPECPRNTGIPGRPLRTEEVREATDAARRIAAIILMQPKLDENYRATKSAAFDWPGDA